MFLIQQLYLLQDVFSHFGESSASFLPTPQHQAVLVVPRADAVQRLPHGLKRKHINICFTATETQKPVLIWTETPSW